MREIMIGGKRLHLVRKVAKSGSVYLVTIPSEIGKLLHKKPILVTIEVLEEFSR